MFFFKKDVSFVLKNNQPHFKKKLFQHCYLSVFNLYPPVHNFNHNKHIRPTVNKLYNCHWTIKYSFYLIFSVSLWCKPLNSQNTRCALNDDSNGHQKKQKKKHKTQKCFKTAKNITQKRFYH